VCSREDQRKEGKDKENGENGDRSPGMGRKLKVDTQRGRIPDYSSGGPQTSINSRRQICGDRWVETDRQRQMVARHPGS
jgi:hypothetical protein